MAATAIDNCAVVGTPAGTRNDGLLLTEPYPVGITTITWTVTDINGNAAVAVTQTVTVTDNQVPVITTSGAITTNNTPGLCSANVSVTAATADDNCGVGSPTGVRSDGLPLGNPYPVGVTTITWNVMDINGNPAIAAIQTVTVTDNQAPVITTSGLITANTDLDECGATIVVTPATATDNCVVGSPVGIRSDGLLLSDPYPVGVTTITWNVMDINGNPAVTATQIISVTDNQVPVITTSGPLTANNTAGLCSAIVPVTAATADDNCGVGSPTGVRSDGLPLGNPYPVGVTTITWNVMDINGNPAIAAIQTVTVTDNQAPVITTSGPLTANNTPGLCSAIVSVTPATATDNCAVQGVPTGIRSDGLALSDPYPVGVTTITWNVSDVNGNPAIVVLQTVTVVDNELPTFAVCPGNITRNNDPGVCGANVTFLIIANDNCGPTTVTQSHPSGFLFPIGTTTVTATATDGAGQIATCTFTVTVTDNQPPATPVLPVLTGSCSVTAPVPTTTDNCQAIVTGTTTDPLTYTTQGTHIINWIFTDPNGNSITVPQTVIVDDNAGPTITCPANITVNADAGVCNAVVGFVVTATDNCAGTITMGYNFAPGSQFPVGTTTVTATATDAAGNSSSCSFTVTVVDNQAPVPALASLPTITGLCSVTVSTIPTANDNCGVVNGTTGTLTFNTPGTYTITWTYTDASGNSATQPQTVVVNNNPGVINTPPVSTAKCVGQPATFTVAATGIGLQWQLNTGTGFNDIGGATTASINIPAVTIGMNNYQYRVIVQGSCGSTISDVVTLTVNPLPALYAVTGGGAFCSGPGVPVGLFDSESGVSYQLQRNGSNTGSPVNGTGNSISFGNQNLNGTYTVVATNTVTTCTSPMTGSVSISAGTLPVQYNVTGSGFICAGTGPVVGLSNSETGVNYQLRRNGSNTGSPVAGTGSAISFGNQNLTGLYTVVATNPTTGCTRNMSGTALLLPGGALPTTFNVTGGGLFCSGPGVAVGLSGSQILVSYQLQRNGSNVGSPALGFGPAISFGIQSQAGVYTVIATNVITGCTSTMNGSTTVIPGTLPALFTVTGGGSFCTGNAGPLVGLSGSETGVSYQLVKNGSNEAGPVAGTGSAISFGIQNFAGTYTIVATHSSGCTRTMTGTAVVIENALPVVYSVTGGGGYCSGAGPLVGLSGSESGVNYQLQRNGTNTGSPVAGNGSAISFGNQNQLGTYTVVATNAGTGCINNMTGSAIINAGTLPALFNVSGSGFICGGVGPVVSLSGSQAGVNYQLRRNGSNTGSPVAGTGSAISFGNQNLSGIYTVFASNPSSGCVRNMSGAALILPGGALPNVYNVTGGGVFCTGTGAVVGLSGSQFLVRYQLQRDGSNTGGTVNGNGSSISFGSQSLTGTYTVVATNIITGCTSIMTGSTTVTPGVLPALFTVTGGGSSCSGPGSGVGLTGSESGVNYQLVRNGSNTGSPVAGTGTTISFGTQAVSGTYTVVAIHPSGCTRTMTGSAIINAGSLPTIFNVTGGGGYCSGPGLPVGLSGSQTGVNYQLVRGGNVNVGTPVAGTGSPISFIPQTIAGFYTVNATNTTTGCVEEMNNSAQITAGTLPALFTVSGSGWICGGVGPQVILSGSQTGVNYQLIRGAATVGSPVAGTGSAINFGNQNLPGFYSVVATSAGNCTRAMTGTATINQGVLPTLFNVIGGGASCSNSVGVEVGLSGSQTTVTYQLVRNGTNIGSPVTGNGGYLNFGLQSPPPGSGSYTFTVVATHVATGCTRNMNGSATVSKSVLPTVFNVSGGGVFCTGSTGVSVFLSNSQNFVRYQLLRNGSPIGSPIIGTAAGGAISFNNLTLAGTYTIVADHTQIAGCTINMNGSATITSGGVAPTAFNVTGGGAFCSGPGVPVGLAGSQTGVSYQLYRNGSSTGSPVNGTGGGISFGNQNLAGTYTVIATTIASGCTNTMSNVATISVSVLPTVFTVTGGGSFCAPPAPVVGLSGSQIGVNYQLQRNGSNTGSPVAGTGSAISFGSQALVGTYTVVASNASIAGCTISMSGNAVVTTTGSLPATSISYTGSPYCQTGSATVTRTGQAGGTYTGTAGLVINSVTGTINLATSTAGSHTVTYTFTNGTCIGTATAAVIIAAIPTATISYAGSPYCKFGTAIVTLTGQAGGTYSSTAGLSLNSSTGAINLVASTVGTYVVTYTFSNGGCTRTTTAVISVVDPPAATISYAGSPYCPTGFATVTRTGTAAGVYTATPAGLAINATTGQINLATSVRGTYTVIYTFSNRFCSNTTTTSVTVNDNQNPVITKPGDMTLCATPTNQFVIPVATGTDNCGTPTISFTVTGATVRSGTGGNASGLFNVGSSQINWRIVDGVGNTVTTTTTVVVANCITATRPAAPESVITKGLRPTLNMTIAAFPNPSQGHFNVKVTSTVKETVEVRMFDMHGRMIEIKRGAPDQIFRFGERVAAGMYIIEARQSGVKEKAEIKVIKHN